jgi:Fe2+ transport system protein FeoA
MDIPLTEAPFGKPLILSAITRPELEDLLSRLGLFLGHTLMREDEEVLLHPVRVRSACGDVVLGGSMALRIIVHLDDGRRLPLTDLSTGDTGHIEGTTCSYSLCEALAVLNLNENDPITYLRQLPHMDYSVIVGENRRERLNEGVAARIWGRLGEQRTQFVFAGKGQAFVVEKVLGGARAVKALRGKGISPGVSIRLEAVAPAQALSLAAHEPVVITTDDGLHLHLRSRQAGCIRVKVEA